MLRIFATETFKEIQLDKSLKLRYAISNYGRLISFKETFEDGRLLKGSIINGYRILRYQIRQDGKTKTQHAFFYNLVAQQFLTKTSEEQLFVLHLDRNRGNDFVDNLKLATREEMLEHSRNSPYVIEGRKTAKEKRIKADGSKLTETNVMWLKKRLLDPNRKTRLKMYAKQFGVSEMQLHRIRTGENWGHIKVNDTTEKKTKLPLT
jgi:hypothetical protein